MLWGLFTVILVLVIDQASKFWIDTALILEKPLIINDYFNLVKVWNTGVSFSMFNNYGKLGAYILISVATIVCCGLLYWMYNEKHKYKVLCLGAIIGGALGNVIDRVRYGAVMDFLDFHYQSHHWPAFNLADTFICIGALVLICFEMVKNNKKGASEQ